MIQINQLSHEFIIGKKSKKQVVPVLHDVDLHVKKGEIVSIVGRSGSGKSTLLNLISGYMKPTSGQIIINGQDVTPFSEGQWSQFRLANLGFIFQSFQLIPSMTAFANVELPLTLKGVGVKERTTLTKAMLKKVGLEGYEDHYPSELSGGQQQRVSVARALIVNPPVILADEPTGSLDNENEQALLQLIRELNEESGITFLIITHDEQVASFAHRTILLENGNVKGGKAYEMAR